MKRIILTLAAALTVSLAARGQLIYVNTNGPTPVLDGPLYQAFSYLTTGTNWMVAPYGLWDTTTKTAGGGIAAVLRVNDWSGTMMRLDYWDHQLWMGSASFQVQPPMTLLGKMPVVPFAFTGLTLPMGGWGDKNGGSLGIFGAGLAYKVSTKFDVLVDYEIVGERHQIRAGLGIKF